MQFKSPEKSTNFYAPSSYRIVVEGHLEHSWSERLAGLRITAIKGKNRLVVTTLAGRIADQAELLGVLNNLYDLHLSLLAVKRRNLPETDVDSWRQMKLNKGKIKCKDQP